MIRAESLCFDVAVETGKTRNILDSLSFHFQPGSITLINGSSGVGKSSLLAILATWTRPTSGLLFLDEKPVSKYSAAFRDRFRQSIGFASQRPLLFENDSVVDNILLPTIPRKFDRKATLARADMLMASLDLAPLAKQKTQNLSGGEMQRVAIARALINRPPILLLDEPSAHQDAHRTNQILALVDLAHKEGSTVVIASHDHRLPKLIALTQSFNLEHGKLLELLP